MIEGGGLGVFAPRTVGPDVGPGARTAWSTWRWPTRPRRSRWPSSTCRTSRVRSPTGSAPTRRRCASCVPEDRRRVYDVHSVIELLADTGSVLELRPSFGARAWSPRWPASRAGRSGSSPTTRCTWPARSTPMAADKAARFLQLCDAYDLPRRLPVRHPRVHGRTRGRDGGAGPPRRPPVRDRGQPDRARSARWCCARATGSAPRPWPAAASGRRCGSGPGRPASSGGMGLEGAVRLGFRRELEAVEDPAEREALFESMVERSYARRQGPERRDRTSRSTT